MRRCARDLRPRQTFGGARRTADDAWVAHALQRIRSCVSPPCRLTPALIPVSRPATRATPTDHVVFTLQPRQARWQRGHLVCALSSFLVHGWGYAVLGVAPHLLVAPVAFSVCWVAYAAMRNRATIQRLILRASQRKVGIDAANAWGSTRTLDDIDLVSLRTHARTLPVGRPLRVSIAGSDYVLELGKAAQVDEAALCRLFRIAR